MGVRIDKVFYELQLQVDDFNKGITNAERSANRFTAFIEKHPIAAVGALTAAMITLGVQATKMAAAVDASLRTVAGRIPGVASNLSALRRELVELAKSGETSRGPEELAQLLEEISRGGAESAAAAMTRLRAVLEATDASGADVHATIEGLDLVLDAFGLSSDHAEEVLAKLVATAANKVPLEQLLAVLSHSATTLSTLGVSLDQAVIGTVALVDAGVPAKQAASGFAEVMEHLASATQDQRDAARELGIDLSAQAVRAKGAAATLQEVAEKTHLQADALERLGFTTQQFQVLQVLGTQANREFADAAIDSATAIEQLHEKAAFTRAGAEELSKILHNQVRAEMLDLGNTVLPLVSKELAGLVGLFDLLKGTVNQINTGAAFTTLKTLSGIFDHLPADKWADALTRLKQAMAQITGPGLGLTGALGKNFITDLSDANLKILRDALQTLTTYGHLANDAARQARANLVALDLEIARRTPTPTGGTPTVAPAGAPAGGGPPAFVIDPDVTKRLRAFEEQFTRGLPELLQRAQEWQTKAQTMLRDSAVAMTATLVDDMQLALDKLTQQFQEQGLALPDSIRQWQQALIDVQPVIEATTGKLDVWDQLAREGALTPLEYERNLQGAIDALNAALATLADTKENQAARLKLEQLILQVQQKQRDVAADAAGAAKDGTQSDAERLRNLRDQARLIADGARGAIQLASAFGIVDEKMASALESLSQIATGIVSAIGQGPLGMASGLLAAAGGLASLVQGLLNDPQRERQAQVVSQNTEAIQALTRTVGEFGKVSSSGQQYTAVQQAIAAALANFKDPSNRLNTPYNAQQLLGALQQVGLSVKDLEQLAQELGITFDRSNFVESLKQLQEALQATQLAQFAETFTGQLQALEDQFKLFDITDPIQQLQQLVALFEDPKFGAPALRQALAGLDLTTPEGRAQAKQAIQNLFQMLQSGAFNGNETALGGMSAQQFLDALLQINGLLSQAGDAAAAAGTTSQFTVERTITEVTGSRLAALLTTGTMWLEQIAAATAATRDLLARAVVPGASLQPPPLAALNAIPLAGSGGVSLTIEQLVINAAGSDAPTLSRAFVDALEQEFLQRFGGTLRARRAAIGTTMLT